MAADTDLTIPAPVAARDGAYIVKVKVEGVPEARNCVLFGWVPGRDIAEVSEIWAMELWGAFAARLHDHGRVFSPPTGFSIVRYDRVFPFDEPIVLFDAQYEHLVTKSRAKLYRAACKRVESAIERLRQIEPMRVLHGDLHRWNVRISRGRVGAIDFEDLMWGWPVQDVATTLYYEWHRDDYPERYAFFRRGYETVAVWPERYALEIETFIAARALVIANDVLLDQTPEIREHADEYFSRFDEKIRLVL